MRKCLALNAGVQLEVIQKLLGYTQLKTTQRYAHLLLDRQRLATGRVGAIVTAAASRPSGAVIPPPPRKA